MSATASHAACDRRCALPKTSIPRIGDQRPPGSRQIHVSHRTSAENAKNLREFPKVRARNKRARNSTVGLQNGHAQNDDHFLRFLVPVWFTDQAPRRLERPFPTLRQTHWIRTTHAAGYQPRLGIDKLKFFVVGEARPDRVEILHEASHLAATGHGLGHYGRVGEHTQIVEALLEPHVGFPPGMRPCGHQLLRNLLRERTAALRVSDERDDEGRDERGKDSKGKNLAAYAIQPKLQ